MTKQKNEEVAWLIFKISWILESWLWQWLAMVLQPLGGHRFVFFWSFVFYAYEDGGRAFKTYADSQKGI